MIPFQADPAESLHPTGGTWVGIVIPAIILLVSIAVSFALYWHFARRAPAHRLSGPPARERNER